MDDSLAAQVQAYLHRLDHLLAEGRRLREAMPAPTGAVDAAGLPRWQQECSATVSRLSGGSKAHWLSRAFSQAFLMPADGRRGAGGEESAARPPGAAAGPALEAAPAQIIDRISDVLSQARRALASIGHDPAALASALAGPTAPRFEFIADADLRSSLAAACTAADAALARGEFALALVTTCSVLEAIVTDALERRGSANAAAPDDRTASLSAWPFGRRIAVAEAAGIISGGCARLPAVARAYRDLIGEHGELRPGAAVTERDAKVSRQVLRLIMRDLMPGR